METKTRASKKTEGAKKDEKKNAVTKDLSASYNRYKKFGGKQYTGVQIGCGYHWHCDEGDWTP